MLAPCHDVPRSPLLEFCGRDRIKDNPFLMCFPMCCTANWDWSIYVRPCIAVLRCHPCFVEVRCDWSIRVASVFRGFALVCLPGCGTFARTDRSMCHLCSVVLTYLVIYTVHVDWFIHVSSVLDSYFGSHPPTRRGVLERRCFECSPFDPTCQDLRCNMSPLETECPSVLAFARGKRCHVDIDDQGCRLVSAPCSHFCQTQVFVCGTTFSCMT